MTKSGLLALLSLAGAATAVLDCTNEAFAAVLPSDAHVVLTRTVAENATFQVPANNTAYPRSPVNLPALCAVQVNVTSSDTSSYQFGLFLPTKWNNRFIAVGNGGFAGGINWDDAGAVVRYGFASVSTDTGHNSSVVDLTWALNDEEAKIDWGFRALHGSVVIAKEITEAFYGSAPEYNYYSGCSTGGRQGLRDLQLYPEDFDGVLAAAPAWWSYNLSPWTVKLGAYNLPVDSPGRIPPAFFPVIEREISRQCDAQDGLRDNIISDPRGCRIFLETLLCTSSNSTGCLTVPQIETLTNIYTDYIDTNQTFVFSRVEPGSEYQWPIVLAGTAPNPLGVQYIQYFVLNDPTWDYRDFDFSIVQLAQSLDPGNATADDFDLTPFASRGGKLLMTHGLADGLISPGSSEVFYRNVYRELASRGVALDDFFRLFLVPGMGHCSGTSALASAPWYHAGPGQAGSLNPPGVLGVPGFADAEHDALLALVRWTEGGVAPDSLISTRFVNDTVTAGVERQRPLCVYPKQARYQGLGDPNSAESWRCGEISNDQVGEPAHEEL